MSAARVRYDPVACTTRQVSHQCADPLRGSFRDCVPSGDPFGESYWRTVHYNRCPSWIKNPSKSLTACVALGRDSRESPFYALKRMYKLSKMGNLDHVPPCQNGSIQTAACQNGRSHAPFASGLRWPVPPASVRNCTDVRGEKMQVVIG